MNTVRICSTVKRVQNAVRASVKNGIHLAAFHWGRGEESRLQSLHSGQGISSPCPLLYLALVGVICFQIKKERPVGRSSKFMLATKQCLLSLTRLVVKLTGFVFYRGFGGTPPSTRPLLPPPPPLPRIPLLRFRIFFLLFFFSCLILCSRNLRKAPFGTSQWLIGLPWLNTRRYHLIKINNKTHH